MPMKKAIEDAKALIKHLQENPEELEKLNKARVDEGKTPEAKNAARFERNAPLKHGAPEVRQLKGVHRPVVKFNSGISDMGLHSNPETKKRHVKNVMNEQKAMPKPNLPKSEMKKGDYFQSKLKGVHKPVAQDSSFKDLGPEFAGQSRAGTIARHAQQNTYGVTKQGNIADAKTQHKKVIGEQRSMPKPNLPKAEMKKGANQLCKDDWQPRFHKKVNEQAQPQAARSVGKEYSSPQVKGINVASTSRPKGVSDVGAMVRNPTGAGAQAGAHKVGIQRRMAEQQKINPKLPKAEMQKGAIDLKDGWAPKFHKPVSDQSKGVNKPAFHPSMLGVSQAHVASAGMSNAAGKDVHRGIIAEQKAMPKPNLPKAEMKKGDDLMTTEDARREQEDKMKVKARKLLNDTAVDAGKIATKFADGKGTLKAAVGKKGQAETEEKEFKQAPSKADK